MEDPQGIYIFSAFRQVCIPRKYKWQVSLILSSSQSMQCIMERLVVILLSVQHPRRPTELLVGTMRYFRARDIFGWKFTSRADKPLGTYSYWTSTRSVWIPSPWLVRKVFFWPISKEVQLGNSVVLLHKVIFLIDCGSCFGPGRFQRSRGNHKL